MTKPRALAQAAGVLALLLGWILASSWLGVGILSKNAAAPLVHAGLTGVLALALVFVATAGDEDRWASLGLSLPVPFGPSAGLRPDRRRAEWLTTVLLGLLGAGAAYVASGILAGGYFLAFGGAKDLADKARAMELLGDLPFAAIVPIALFAGFYEEVVFRGFLLDRLRIVFGQSRRGLVLAVLVSSALFAGGHAYQGALGIIQTFAAGACFAALAAIRRSLWSSIIAHAVIDLFGLFALHYLRPFLEKALEQQGIHGIP